MRLVVTGVNGQVVRSLAERGLDREHEVISLGRPELDLAGHSDSIVAAIQQARPEVLVSAAAYTAVDNAEREPVLAFAVNEAGAAAVACAARRLSIPLIHLSTDYVFDGTKTSPYSEEDVSVPTGVYGASKLAGEMAVLAEHDDTAVLRTAWVYSPFGVNFVKTMLRLAGARETVRVVADQRGNPTSALDIADGILAVAVNLVTSGDPTYRGVFHMAAAGEASWAELAEAIFVASAEAGGPAATVMRISTDDYPTIAIRPANSQLDCTKLERTHGVRLPAWPDSVKEVVLRLIALAQNEQKRQN